MVTKPALMVTKPALMVTKPAHRRPQVYIQLELELSIPPDRRLYCPHKDCSRVLERGAAGDEGDVPTECPYCNRGFCPRCLIPGWHKV